MHALAKYLAGLNEGRSGAPKYKQTNKQTNKQKTTLLKKIKPKERKGMIVVQIYILAFPIDKKKERESFTRLILLSGMYRGFL